MQKKLFGIINDKEVYLYTLSNSFGLSVSVCNYGCAICSIALPDKNGIIRDVVLGFDTLEEYIHQKYYIGTVIGRCANRIKGAVFKLNGFEYKVSANEGIHHLHGGFKGFNDILWDVESWDENRIIFHYISKDMEEGYPGNLDVRVCYELTAENAIHIQYRATCDKDTIVNLTNHSYFNLGSSGSITDHTLSIFADAYTDIDEDCIPTGSIKKVKGTPFDFQKETRIGDRLNSRYQQMLYGNGYNHNYVLNNPGRKQCMAAELKNYDTGIKMTLFTTEPGLQLYTGNYLQGDIRGKNGITYLKNAGVSLETQGFPNAVQNPHFPSVILNKGDLYTSKTILIFKLL